MRGGRVGGGLLASRCPWLTAYGSVAGGSCCPLAAIARSLKQFIKTASEVRDTEVDVFPLLSLHGTALTVIVSGLFRSLFRYKVYLFSYTYT